MTLRNTGRPEETPYLIVGVAQVERNLSEMAHAANQLGVKLRPHIKTHKIPQLAQRQIELGATGITVAKISEAEVMASAGIRDIFVAHPIVVRRKAQRAVELSRKVRLTVGVDSLVGAERLSEVAIQNEHTLDVRLEVDTGLRRCGVVLDEALELARKIGGLEGIRLTGIYTYRGAFSNGSPTQDFERAGTEEGEIMSLLAEEMRSQGIAVEDVSVGSTPTAKSAAKGKNVTEIRPGTYIFYDRMQSELGVCSLEDCAAVIVATIASRPSANLAVVDAGSKTFATDVQPNTQPLGMPGFGHIVGDPEVVLDRLWEEHGTLKLNGASQDSFQVGDSISIIPNHICSTVNLHNAVWFAREDGSYEKVEVAARGQLE